MKETLCDTEVQLDASQLAATVKSIKEQYKELLLEHPTLAQQAGLAHELDDYVREVVRHPSVRLLTEPLEHWSDIIPICLHLNQHREEAIRGASPLDQESNSDQGLESIIQQLKKLLINTDGNLPLSGEELLHRLTPILSVLSSALQGLGTQTHYLHPSKYPTYFATIVSVMKQHGPAIQRAELAMLPVDAVAQRILDLFCVIYRKQNPEGVKILDDALNGHVATWSRQEKRVFAAALISDNPDADETLLCLASRLNHEVEKGHKLEIREDNGRGVWKKLPSSKDHEHQSKELAKVNRNTALVLASEYRPDFSRITVGVTKKHLIIAGLEYPITKRGCDLKVNELNLPQLMKCPSISQHIYRAQIDQHLDALAAGRKNFEWLDPEDKELLKERSTLPKNLEVPIKKRASGEELQRQAAAWKIEPVEERIPGKPSKENAISALFHKALPWKKS
ncbi:hypothetical protein [Endozoicomonas atrinae]|uniref:hypothetical protein n=1 Tax=Endozoicomonas atrinae TaxID=1333660 RepID=UPI001112DAB7|nr:hypothetical protein [Endozoicomonas atrinae]